MKQFLFAAGMGTLVLLATARPVEAGSLAASYFSMAENDPDVANNQGIGTVSTAVGAGLGPDGLPVASAFGIAHLHDIDPTTGEIEWWSPALDSNVSVLDNPVYPGTITLPFSDSNMYTNTTVLGQNGNDASAFLTAEFTGSFTVAAAASISFNVCSDDDEFVYLSGGAFGAGTDIVDNGGIHGLSCTGPNENTDLLADVAAGTYTLSVFYADREQTGAQFQLSSSLDLIPVSNTPEPGTLGILGAGFAALLTMRRKRI